MAGYEFPASFAQQRMWLLNRMDPDEPVYNIAWALWLDGALDVTALRQAWDAALARHEALRTTLRDNSGLPVQVIDDEPPPRPLPVTSVEHLAEPEREPAARALIAELARAPFDLAAGPLVLGRLVRLSPERHVLAVVMHHIVADGWSFRILFDELSADYQAIRRGDPTAGEPPIQYADFAIWQIEHAAADGYAQAERFWRAELADAPAELPLPTDEPYPPRQAFAAASIDTGIDAALAGALRRVASDHQATLFAVLLTAYAVVLSRLTGRDDLLITVPVAARTRPETESVVGVFMNTVAVRVRVDPRVTLGDLVRSVHAATARALAHQELPFARVVELVRPDRHPARLPLVQVMFAMEESWAVPDRGGLRWTPELADNGTARFEIELTVTDAPGGPQVRTSYNTGLFHETTGRLVADGFSRVLGCLAQDPGLAAGDVEIMSPQTRALVTTVWPDGGEVTEPEATAVAMLWRACSGDAVVVRGSDGALTGDAVRERAQQLAAALHAHGVGMSDRVAVLVPRGARILPVILGIWLAGASYLPLDTAAPPQRLAMMIGDAGVRALVTDSGAAGAPDAGYLPPGTPAVAVDLAALPAPGDWPPGRDDRPPGQGDGLPSRDDGLPSRDDGPPGPIPGLPPSGPACMIFTSGSTGRPKAVAVTQNGVATLLNAVRPLLALGPQDRFVAVSSFAFDIAMVELTAPVLAGGCVIVADTEQVHDAAALRDLLTAVGATAMQATPTGWRMLAAAGGVPAGVRLRMTAGEPLSRDLADAIGDGPGVRLFNLYGPTETTIYSGGAAVGPSPEPIEIGSVIAGTRLYVLDERRRPVPPGVIGEVYVGGAGVAQGYHSAPGLTASRFVPDPYGPPGARLYRTGDLGRWRRSGRIELAGRADRQFKIRGYRVESGDVEAALRGHPDVEQAVVSVRRSDRDARLVGYLVSRSGASQPPADLAGRLREVLPDYMIPAAFVVVPAFPLTGSGKIDHRALPEPEWGSIPGQVAVAPRTPAESQLSAIVAELLELPAPPGVTDNFFALGGHSLTATRLMARIAAVWGVDLPLRTLFSDPTVAGLAGALDAALDGRVGAALVPGDPR
jgi:amino acid adenylation domain-containing protein